MQSYIAWCYAPVWTLYNEWAAVLLHWSRYTIKSSRLCGGIILAMTIGKIIMLMRSCWDIAVFAGQVGSLVKRRRYSNTSAPLWFVVFLFRPPRLRGVIYFRPTDTEIWSAEASLRRMAGGWVSTRTGVSIENVQWSMLGVQGRWKVEGVVVDCSGVVVPYLK